MAGRNDDDREDHDDDDHDEDEDIEEDDAEDEESEDDDDLDDEESEDALVERIVAALGPRIEDAVESRVKGPIRGMRRELRRSGDGQGRRKGREDDEDDKPVADTRAARSAAREYISDSGVRFTSETERAATMELVSGLIAVEASRGFDDEDEVGRRVARKAVQTVTELRKATIRAERARLRKSGALQPGKGQPRKGSPDGSGKSDMAKGAAKAKAMFPDPQ